MILTTIWIGELMIKRSECFVLRTARPFAWGGFCSAEGLHRRVEQVLHAVRLSSETFWPAGGDIGWKGAPVDSEEKPDGWEHRAQGRQGLHICRCQSWGLGVVTPRFWVGGRGVLMKLLFHLIVLQEYEMRTLSTVVTFKKEKGLCIVK